MSDLARTAADLAKNALTVLPPAFVVLCAINLVFLWLVTAFIEHAQDQKMAIFNKIIERCIQ